MAHGVGDRTEDSDRRRQHHDIRELEHCFGKALGKSHQRLSFCFRHHRQRDSEKNAEDHHLQHLAFGYGLCGVFRKHVENQIGCRVWRYSRHVFRR